MAFLSLVTTVVDAANQRIDQPQDDGTYAPVVLRIGDNLTASADPLGGQTAIQIDAVTAAPSGDTPLAVAASADPGTSSTVSKSDHVHDLSWGAVAAASALATSPLSIQSPWGVNADHVELGASPAGTGQVRATDGVLVAWDDSGTDRDALTTSGPDLTVGPGAGSITVDLGNAGTFAVQDAGGTRLSLTPTGTTVESKVTLYGGAVTHAATAGDIGLSSTGRLTVWADGAEKTVLVTGDAGGGATLYPALDSHDLGYWDFSEASGNFVNGGTAAGVDLVPSGSGLVYGQASPLGRAAFANIGTNIESAAAPAIRPTAAASILLLVRPQYFATATTRVGVFGIADPTAPKWPFILFTNTYDTLGFRGTGIWNASINTTVSGFQTITMADGISGDPDYTGFHHQQWNLLAITYDGATLKAYVDGGLVNSLSVTGAIDYTGVGNTGIVAGGSTSKATWKTLGWLGYMRIRDVAMSADDIRLAYRHAMGWA